MSPELSHRPQELDHSSGPGPQLGKSALQLAALVLVGQVEYHVMFGSIFEQLGESLTSGGGPVRFVIEQVPINAVTVHL